MRYRLLAGLLGVLLPGLTWAGPWKDEGVRGWGRSRSEPQSKPSFWSWRRAPSPPSQPHEGPVGPVVAPAHPGLQPVPAPVPQVEGSCPCASSPGPSRENYAPVGAAPARVLSVPVSTPRSEPAEQFVPAPKPMPSAVEATVTPPAGTPRPLPRGPEQAPMPPAAPLQDSGETPR